MNYQTKDVDLDQYNIFFSSGYGESTSDSSLTGGHKSNLREKARYYDRNGIISYLLKYQYNEF